MKTGRNKPTMGLQFTMVFSLLAYVAVPIPATEVSLLNGKHIVVSGLEASIDFRVIRNSSGHILELNGVSSLMLSWLSKKYSFTYSPLQVNKTIFDPDGDKPGYMSYILSNECDIVSNAALTSTRIALVEMSHPTLYVPVSFMIPAAESKANLLSLTQPFRFWVWITILAAFGLVLVSLYLFIWHSSLADGSATPDGNKAKATNLWKRDGNQMAYFILGLFLRQVGYCRSKRITIRLIVGTVGLASFILHNYYTADITSFMAAPNPQPLIKSIYEVPQRPDLRLVVDRNLAVEAILTSATYGIYKKLGNILRADPNARCTGPRQCGDMVKEGGTVYTAGRDANLFNAVREDYRLTGKCNLDVSKESYLNAPLFWALKKQSPYTFSINRGTMRMREVGLLSKWYKENSPDPRPCLRDKRAKYDRVIPAASSLKSLLGAFVVLIIGLLISVLGFILETLQKIRV